MNPQDFTKFAGVEQFESAYKTGQDTVAKVQKAAKETADKMFKASADAWTKGYDKFTAASREQVEKAFPQGVSKFDEAASFGKENMDAAFAVSAIAQKGAETLVNEIVSFQLKAYEAGLAGLKSVVGVKTVQELVEKQTTLARAAFDNAVAGATKMSEMGVKVANEVAEPIQARFTKAAEKFAKPLAA